MGRGRLFRPPDEGFRKPESAIEVFVAEAYRIGRHLADVVPVRIEGGRLVGLTLLTAAERRGLVIWRRDQELLPAGTGRPGDRTHRTAEGPPRCLLHRLSRRGCERLIATLVFLVRRIVGSSREFAKAFDLAEEPADRVHNQLARR